MRLRRTVRAVDRRLLVLVGAVAMIPVGACGSSAPATAPTTVPVIRTAPVPPAATAPTTPATTTARTTTTGPTARTTTTGPTAPTTPTGPNATTTSEAAVVAACTTADLSAGLGHPDGTAGALVYDLDLYNTGTAPCTLRGYPGVSFVAGADGHQVGSPAGRRSSSVAIVTVAPGHAAQAQLSVSDAANFPGGCRITKVLGFRVYPPGSTTSLFVPHTDQACATPSYNTLGVGPVHPS